MKDGFIGLPSSVPRPEKRERFYDRRARETSTRQQTLLSGSDDG